MRPESNRSLRTVSILGLISALIPFFGVPTSIKTLLIFVFGIAIFSVAFSVESVPFIQKIFQYSHIRPRQKDRHNGDGNDATYNNSDHDDTLLSSKKEFHIKEETMSRGSIASSLHAVEKAALEMALDTVSHQDSTAHINAAQRHTDSSANEVRHVTPHIEEMERGISGEHSHVRSHAHNQKSPITEALKERGAASASSSSTAASTSVAPSSSPATTSPAQAKPRIRRRKTESHESTAAVDALNNIVNVGDTTESQRAHTAEPSSSHAQSSSTTTNRRVRI